MNDIGDIIASLRSAMPELQRQWPIRSLALFGSRARDDATPMSDLDVLVAFTRPFPMSSFLALEERLAAITELRVDLVSEAALKPYMGKHILARGHPSVTAWVGNAGMAAKAGSSTPHPA